MRLDYYNLKNTNCTCRQCNWTGLGSELEPGEMYLNDCFSECLCPKCGYLIGTVLFPTFEEVMEKGSEEEKSRVKERIEFEEKLKASKLKDTSQLPDMDSAFTMVLTESEEGEERYITFFAKETGKHIWREIRAYENYERLFVLVEMFKTKYGALMQGFEIEDVAKPYLYGDCSWSALKKIDKMMDELNKDK